MGEIGVIIVFGFSAAHVAIGVNFPGAWWSWAAAVFCFGIGIAMAIENHSQE